MWEILHMAVITQTGTLNFTKPNIDLDKMCIGST
jgi:hypothetical protein